MTDQKTLEMLVDRDRARQGLPVRIEDGATLARVAELIRSSEIGSSPRKRTRRVLSAPRSRPEARRVVA
jgi:hypothetical protein